MTKSDKQSGAIIHCRVSSAGQAQEGESLETQSKVCEKIRIDKGWLLAHEPWLESISGRKKQRDDFQEILSFLDKNPGKVQHYIFRSIDRFTRGGSFVYEQMKRELTRRGVEMIDSYGVIQPSKNTLEHLGIEYEWSKQYPSKISEVVMATTAESEITNILTRMIGQEIQLTRDGYKVRASQDGYVNKKIYVDGKKKTIQEADKERARYYIAMYELRASGQYTDKEIVERINAMGYRTKLRDKWNRKRTELIGKTGGHLLTVKKLQHHIKKPIYCGVIVEKWTNYKPVKAQYSGLVSIETFNAANRGKVYLQQKDGSLEILYNHSPERLSIRRLRNNPDFPYKFIRCPICKKPFCGSYSTGKSGDKFGGYHCSRNHKYIRISKTVFEKNVEEFFNKLNFHPEILNSLRAVLIDRYRERQGEVIQAASEIGYNVAELEIQKSQLARAFTVTEEPTLRKELEKQFAELSNQITNAQTERNKLEINDRDIDNFIDEAKYLMEHPAEMLLNTTNLAQRQSLLELVFEETPDYDEILNGTPKLTWIFKLSSEFLQENSQVVTLQSLEWNTLKNEVSRWNNIIFLYPSPIRVVFPSVEYA